MSVVGITGFGAYVPRLRLQRSAIAAATAWFNSAAANSARGEKAVASWDEDAITMAVEAARDCLIGRDRESLSAVFLASTSLPFADRQNAGIVKEALALPDTIGSMDVCGSQRSGVSALIAALDRSRATDETVLCLASEKRAARPASAEEMWNGDAAAALVVGSSELLAEHIGSHSVTIDFVDHYRASDREHDYGWEGRWIRDEGYLKLLVDAVQQGLVRHGLSPDDIDHFVLGLPVAGAEKLVARALGIGPERVVDTLHSCLGYAGAAHPLLMLSQLLADAGPNKRIATIGFGQGVDMVLLRTTDRAGSGATGMGVAGWLARRQPESNYLKYLHFGSEVQLESGMRAELDLKASHSALYRDRRTVLGLVGGKCRVTGAVQYPRTRVSVAPNARMTDTQDDYPLADIQARIVTVTADHLAYSPDPPAIYGMIEFEGGGRFIADMVDIDDTLPQPGAPMRMMFRRKRVDSRGFIQYFWKAAPHYGA